MQQFIQMATSALGTSEQAARALTGGLLDIIATHAPQADVAALLNRLPGASELLGAFRAAPPPPPPDPGLLGSLSNAASAVLGAGSSMLGTGSNVLGAGAASLGGLAALLDQQGLDLTRAPQLVALFAQWAGQQAGPDLVQRVLGAVPGVSALVGTLGTLGTSAPRA
jgi:hypothetical protein